MWVHPGVGLATPDPLCFHCPISPLSDILSHYPPPSPSWRPVELQEQSSVCVWTPKYTRARAWGSHNPAERSWAELYNSRGEVPSLPVPGCVSCLGQSASLNRFLNMCNGKNSLWVLPKNTQAACCASRITGETQKVRNRYTDVKPLKLN